jgi:hypothetical protein
MLSKSCSCAASIMAGSIVVIHHDPIPPHTLLSVGRLCTRYNRLLVREQSNKLHFCTFLTSVQTSYTNYSRVRVCTHENSSIIVSCYAINLFDPCPPVCPERVYKRRFHFPFDHTHCCLYFYFLCFSATVVLYFDFTQIVFILF